MVSLKNIQFIGLMPNLIECCDFIPPKYKGHKVAMNRALHKLGTLGVLGALFLCTSSPDISLGLVAGSFGSHIVGHFIEGFFS
tara:strand:- start:24 stop:272 length:249 start_codon:yes stop_codon:yes gene_type:complete